MNYLEVKNWRKWQSYRSDRGAPPWIKVQRGLLTSSKWAMLRDKDKGALLSIWLVAAEREGRVPADGNVLRKICLLDEVPDLARLVDLGFLTSSGCQDDVKLASTGCQVGSPEQIREEKIRGEEKKKCARDFAREARSLFMQACQHAGCESEALDWEAVLKKKKAAMTETAWKRRLTKLQRMAETEPPADILARSADAGWSDLYERRKGNGNHRTSNESAVERRKREAQEALRSGA